MTADDEDRLLRSVAQQNAETIRASPLREPASLLDLTHEAIFICERNGTIKYWNRGAEELYGWPAEQAVGRVTWELLKTIYPRPFQQIEEEVIGAGRWEGELVQTRQDGSQVIVASRWSLQRDDSSAPTAILVFNNDITRRKRAESLFAGEKRILEMAATGGSLAEILDSLCRLVEEHAPGVLASILLLDGNRLRHGGGPSLPTAYTDAINGMAIGASAGSCGTAAYRGEQVIVEDIANDPLWADYRDLALSHSLHACWSTPVLSPHGEVIATFAMYYREPRRPTRDDREIIDQITHLAGVAIQQKSAQEKLQRSEAYLAEAQKLTHTGSWAWDVRNQKVLFCSEEMFRIYGLDPQEPPTREKFRQRIHPDDRDWAAGKMDEALREKVDSFGEYRVVRPDGTIRHVNASGHPVVDEHGELIEWVGTDVDVTERKRTELERQRLALLVEQAADLMAIADLSGGTPIYLNEAGLKMVGFDSWEEARTRRGIHYMFPEDRQFVNEVLWPTVLEKGSWSGEMQFRHFKTGDPIPVLYTAFRIDDPETGQPVNVGNVCRDITQQKQTEAQARETDRRYREMQTELAHANRVATMGQLTASIAHEVNQPIAAMVTNAQAALRWLLAGTRNLDEVQQALTRIVRDGIRAGEVVNRSRALIKKAPPSKDRLGINGVILEIIELTRGEAVRNGISISTDLADNLPAVEADRVQLQQVLVNLIVNAIEAMGATSEGPRELLISTGKAETGAVLVALQDSGPGLEAAMLERAFESFYTTKPTGLGMGLSICRSIIEAHGGQLWASRNQRRGATFQFTLPAEAEFPS